jgi:putative drug exporter of the RND superfamily
MIRISKLAIRHPWVTLTAWVVLVAGLGLLGSRIEDRFTPSILVAKGTESARAQKLANDQFGASVLTPIMLVGPARTLDQQGPRLAEKLRARPDIRVLSPWDGTPGSDVLRPKRTAATIVAAVDRPEKDVIATTLPRIERIVDRSVSPPVVAHVTGQASIDRAMREQSLDQTRVALLIAIPLVFLVLLAVLRAPVAALAVTAFGVSVLPVGYGLTALAATLIDVDAIAVAGASMMGLASGAAFGTFMVTRFRDDLRAEGSHGFGSTRAATRAAAKAGRAILLAGTAMVVAMITATSLSMTEILNSIGIGATGMAFVATAAAVGVLPAGLRLLGPRVEAGSFGAEAPRKPQRVLIPVATGVFVLLVMLALSSPVLTLESGPPDAKLLPASNQARQDYEAVAKVMGAGWVSPFEIVVARNGSPITTRRFLASIDRFENRTKKIAGVRSVLGPGALLANANDLQGVPKGLNTAASTATKSKKELKKLIAGLKLATDGVAQLRGGLGEAAGGAGQLHGGTDQAYGGSGQLKSGLDQADAGARKLKVGAAAAAQGAKDLSGGLALAQQGVAGGLPTIDKLINAVNSNAKDVNALTGPSTLTNSELAAASSALAEMTVGRDDPHYAAVQSGLEKAASSNQALAGAIATAGRNAQLNATAIAVVKQQVQDLQKGIGKLAAGSNELSAGLGTLAKGNSDLAGGIAQLDAGGAALQDGLRQLNDGAGQLAAGLSSGAGPSGELYAGMNTITKAVIKSRAAIPSTKDLEQLRREAPGLFDSGYFVLAAIDGAPPSARDAATFVVNAENGGFAGRITVVPKQPASTAAAITLRDRLSDATAAFAERTHAQAAVGGTGANLVDYRELGMERLPVVIAALSLLSLFMLIAITRSFLTALAAVLLNLLTAGVAFGALSMLFSGEAPALGGPGFVDPVTMISIVTVILALGVQYEIYALERLRFITGAGVATIAALLPFAGASLIVVRQLAIGMAIAIAIDSLVVRRLVVAVKERKRRLHVHASGPRFVHH